MRLIEWAKQKLDGGPTLVRRQSNAWLWAHTADVPGRVLSIGSGDDEDRQGRKYRDYFRRASGYVTSEMQAGPGVDLVIDVTRMPEVASDSYDCVFCSGVLEHVVDFQAALREMTRVLKPGGVMLLGVPFRQAIHNAPIDYWRFTEGGLRHLLEPDYEILLLDGVEESVPDFPVAYWAKAVKKTGAARAVP